MKSIICHCLSFFIIATFLSSCNGEKEKGFNLRFSSPPPTIDRSTPDRLIRSTWSYYSWLTSITNDSTLLPSFLSDRARYALLERTRKEKLESAKAIEKYDILKVSTETESRATVIAWEDKDTLSYILTNPGNGWLVDDRQVKCWKCSGSGKETDYESWKTDLYSSVEPKKTCTSCDGRGVRSTYYSHTEK